MSVRVIDPQGGARGSGARLSGTKGKLVSTVREVARKVAEHASQVGEREREIYREIPELNAYVVAWSPSNNASVNFKDMVVDEKTGRLEEERVASVRVVADPFEPGVELTTIRKLPVNWRPPPSLSLLPAAFNTVLSAFKVGRVLSRGFGLRLEARGVSVRRMYGADDLRRRPVVLVDFDLNGRRLTFSRLVANLKNHGVVRGATLDYGMLLRHGDRGLARRLYVLARISRELERDLERFCEEKGYGYVEVSRYFSGGLSYYTYRVDLGGKEVEITRPHLARVTYFDEEYILSEIWETHETRDGELNLAEKLEEKVGKELEKVERESARALTMLVEDARRLMRSGDPRERELGHLLAWIVVKAYEEAKRAIPE